jgi:hypothetical protein
VVLIVASILIYYWGPELPNLTPGLNERAKEIGRTLGGIHGKRAGEALTPNNQTAELYDPVALDADSHKRGALRNLVRRCPSSFRPLVRLGSACRKNMMARDSYYQRKELGRLFRMRNSKPNDAFVFKPTSSCGSKQC